MTQYRQMDFRVELSLTAEQFTQLEGKACSVHLHRANIRYPLKCMIIIPVSQEPQYGNKNNVNAGLWLHSIRPNIVMNQPVIFEFVAQCNYATQGYSSLSNEMKVEGVIVFKEAYQRCVNL